MKILGMLLLILASMSSTIFAQNSENSLPKETPKAKLSSEFGKVPNGQIRSLVDTFFAELQNEPLAKGYIINYGTNRQVAAREKLLRNHITFRNQDASRITFVRGTGKDFNTQLWFVPNGAEPPTP